MSILDRDYARKAPRWHAGEKGAMSRPPLHPPMPQPPPPSLSPSPSRAPLYRRRRSGAFGRLVRGGFIFLGLVFLAVAAVTYLNPQMSIAAIEQLARVEKGQLRLVIPAQLAPSVHPAEDWAVVPRPYRGLQGCALLKFDYINNDCKGEQHRFAIRHFGIIRLTVSGKAGHYFSNTTVRFIVGKDLGLSRTLILGHMDQVVALNMNMVSISLHDVFHKAHITPHSGTTYTIDAASGTVPLGTIQMTITR